MSDDPKFDPIRFMNRPTPRQIDYTPRGRAALVRYARSYGAATETVLKLVLDFHMQNVRAMLLSEPFGDRYHAGVMIWSVGASPERGLSDLAVMDTIEAGTWRRRWLLMREDEMKAHVNAWQKANPDQRVTYLGAGVERFIDRGQSE